MIVRLQYHAPQTATLEVDADEARTIYFALLEYADNLNKSLKNTQVEGPETGSTMENITTHEEKVFLHDTLGNVHRLLFDLLEDHDPTTKKAIAKWLDVV